jgi:hypothetical protein
VYSDLLGERPIDVVKLPSQKELAKYELLAAPKAAWQRE